MNNQTQRLDATMMTDPALDELYALVDKSAAKNRRADKAAEVLRAAPTPNDPLIKAHLDQALALLTQEN